MPDKSNNPFNFWKELKRRKVIPILIAYVATCYAVIEFFDITSNRFAIPDKTFDLLYLLAAVGIPVAIILPWFLYRKKQSTTIENSAIKELSSEKEGNKEQHNLPEQLTNFIGREKEIQTIRELVSKHRIVSLTGAGGCGKTRLACEVAAKLVQDYKDGVWFVDLAPISTVDLVAKEIIEVLKIQEEPGRTITETLIDKIKGKSMLIILDNCEHLIKTCAEITGNLVQSVPGLHVLVTSREALNIKGEKVWRIQSLTLLDPKTIIDIESAKSSEAVLLFTDRAQMNNPEFELETANVSEVVTICNKLDGIPLALELVASRTRHMNTQMILERFADSFDLLSSSDPGTSKRQETLQATIEWSFSLLSDSEKLLFTRLAVFSGGFDLEAAEEVCSDDKLTKASILEILSRLVDRSMIYTVKGADNSMRYSRLETLRQFSRHKLQAGKEEEDSKTRHLHFYLKMAEEAYEGQLESQLKWLDKLEQNHDNFMTALDWSHDHAPEEFSKMSGALAWFWSRHSHFATGKDYLEKALLNANDKSEINARILFGFGYLLVFLLKIERATKMMKESLKLWRMLDNPIEEAYSLSTLSACQVSFGEHATGLKGCEQALQMAREIGKPGLINHCLHCLCQAYVHSKNFIKGRPIAEELIISSEKLEQTYGIIGGRHLYSDCILGEGNYKEAEKQYGLALESAIQYKNTFQALCELQGITFALSGQSRLSKSILLFAASNEKFRLLGTNIAGLIAFWDEWIETYIGGAKEKLGKELTQKYEEEGTAMGFEKAVEYALDFKKD